MKKNHDCTTGFVLLTVMILLTIIALLVMDNLYNADLQLKITNHQLKNIRT